MAASQMSRAGPLTGVNRGGGMFAVDGVCRGLRLGRGDTSRGVLVARCAHPTREMQVKPTLLNALKCELLTA